MKSLTLPQFNVAEVVVIELADNPDGVPHAGPPVDAGTLAQHVPQMFAGVEANSCKVHKLPSVGSTQVEE